MRKETNEPTNWDEIVFNKLKAVDVSSLEEAIAKTISDLVGIKYKCQIDKIRYGDYSSGKGATFKVAVWEASHK
ncbi:MAG: hypothetical protein AB1489_35360 [Acidobacteriota bacterium]